SGRDRGRRGGGGDRRFGRSFAWSRTRRRWRAEYDVVATRRDLYPDGVARSFARVVGRQFRAQAASLDADDRVEARVEGGAALEHLDADRVFLQALRPARPALLDHVAQEPLQPRRATKPRAPEDP